MADQSKKDNDASNKLTDESENRSKDEKSTTDKTSNDASNKLTDESEKKNIDENNGLKAQDDSSKDDNSPIKPGIPDEDNTQFEDDSSIQSAEAFKENIQQQYDNYRSTAQTLMYLIDHMDREKVSKWLSRLDEMNDDEGQLERMYYLKYLVATLSNSFGLDEPFTALPPHTIKNLSLALPPAVFAELLDRNEDTAELLVTKPIGSQKPVTERRSPIEHYDYNDKLFFEQQLFPPEGLICYAAAFSVLPDRNDEE